MDVNHYFAIFCWQFKYFVEKIARYMYLNATETGHLQRIKNK